MQNQVIVIDQDGSLSGLMRKQSEGIDLRSFGEAKVERASLIEFDEAAQKFYVKFLLGDLTDRKLTYGLYAAAMQKAVHHELVPQVMFFDQYEEGVEKEIETLNAINAAGMIFTDTLLDIVSPKVA